MRRTLTVALLFSTLVVFGCWLIDVADNCHVCWFPDLSRDASALEQIRQQRDAFVPAYWTALDELASGKLSLRAAVERIRRHAEECHPLFLRHVELAESGRDLDRKLAHNLLMQFSGPVADLDPPVDLRVRERLKLEYQQLVAAES